MSLSSCLPNPCLFLLVYVGGGVGSAPPPLLVLQPPDHHAKQEKVRLHRIGSEESALREASTKRDEGSGSQSSDRSLEKQRRKKRDHFLVLAVAGGQNVPSPRVSGWA